MGTSTISMAIFNGKLSVIGLIMGSSPLQHKTVTQELASIPIQARFAVPQVALEPAEHVDYGALEGQLRSENLGKIIGEIGEKSGNRP